MPPLRPLITILAFISFLPAQAQTRTTDGPRKLFPLSGHGWQFFGGGESDTLPDINTPAFDSAPWTKISIPHTFQDRRDMSTVQGWYRTRVTIPKGWPDTHYYLVFEGASTVADVYVNGRHLGQHRGAYTRFIFDATAGFHPGTDNQLAVRIDDRASSITDCLPNKNGLYTVWGGLYRHVWLMTTNDLQVDPTWYASPGVFITPGSITDQSASVAIKVMLLNDAASAKSAKVTASILDPAGRVVQTLTASATVPAGQRASVNLNGDVSNPLHWTPETPNLYHVRVDVADSGHLSDSVTQPLGFHAITWDFASGTLQLFGKPFVLYGTDLHQEIESKNYAVEPADLIANVDTLKDLGANWVRLAHYPRAQLEYDQCDQRGIFVWAENGHSHNDNVTPTADSITTEMVEQNYNHPSIIVWSVGNEGAASVAEAEVPVVRALDSTRPVVVANMKCANADFRAQNTYPGWYGHQQVWDFHPHGFISETGAGGVVTCHTDYAAISHKVDSIEPEEYQQLCAETQFETLFRHTSGGLGMYTWWILRDFNDIKYKKHEAPFDHGINTKGLLTYAGDKKDVYYLYRSFLRPGEPTLHITSQRYFLRQGAVDNGIKVYSNAHSVTLTLNGQSVSTRQNGQYSQAPAAGRTGSTEIDNVFFWPVPLHTGKNVVVATDDRGLTDTAIIYFYGANGLPEVALSSPLLSSLSSSNAANPAYYMDMPVKPQWPVYYDFDSTADNSLNLIPGKLQGATWLALRRVTKQGQATDISFTLAKPATVSVLCTKQDTPPAWLTAAGFNEVTAGPIDWRGNDMTLVPAQLYSQHFAAGKSVKLPLGDRDTLILFNTD